jgi:uncharacterized protein
MTASLPEFSPFFEHARQGQLCFPKCGSCGRFHWYPMPRCPHCRSAGWRWQPVSTAGEIHSFTIVRHAFDQSRRDALPYIVALVTFADAPGIRLVTNIVDADASTPRIGQRVEPVFSKAADGRICFRLCSADRSAP